jgi:hypothetical protein
MRNIEVVDWCCESISYRKKRIFWSQIRDTLKHPKFGSIFFQRGTSRV